MEKSPLAHARQCRLALVKTEAYFVRSVVSIKAGFAVDAHGVLQAVDANPSSCELARSIQTSLLAGNMLIVVTVCGFIVTITF